MDKIQWKGRARQPSGHRETGTSGDCLRAAMPRPAGIVPDDALGRSCALIWARFSALQRHIEDLRSSARDNTECANADVNDRLVALAGVRTRGSTTARQPPLRRHTVCARLDASARRAERRALGRLQRLSRNIAETELALVRAMLIRMDADTARSGVASHATAWRAKAESRGAGSRFIRKAAAHAKTGARHSVRTSLCLNSKVRNCEIAKA
jgi:hypothetical protein